MQRIHEEWLRENAGLIDQVRNHSLFAGASTGRVGEASLHTLLSDAYRSMSRYTKSLAHLAVRAPYEFRAPLLRMASGLLESYERVEELVAGSDVDVRNEKVSFPQHAYSTFSASTVLLRSFEESIVVFYATDHAFFPSFASIRRVGPKGDRLYDSLDLLGDDRFVRWTDQLAEWIDRVWETAAPATRERMREIFPVPIYFLVEYLDHLLAGTDGWPGATAGGLPSPQPGTAEPENSR